MLASITKTHVRVVSTRAVLNFSVQVFTTESKYFISVRKCLMEKRQAFSMARQVFYQWRQVRNLILCDLPKIYMGRNASILSDLASLFARDSKSFFLRSIFTWRAKLRTAAARTSRQPHVPIPLNTRCLWS